MLVHPTQTVEIFANVCTPFGTLATRWHPQKILRRSSHVRCGRKKVHVCYLISWWVLVILQTSLIRCYHCRWKDCHKTTNSSELLLATIKTALKDMFLLITGMHVVTATTSDSFNITNFYLQISMAAILEVQSSGVLRFVVLVTVMTWYQLAWIVTLRNGINHGCQINMLTNMLRNLSRLKKIKTTKNE